MKRNTSIMVGVFALLLVAWLLSSRQPKSELLPPLDMAGYLGNVSEQEARTASKDTPSPVSKIVLQRKDETIVLQRTQEAVPAKPAEGDKPAEPAIEAKWQAERTWKGKKSEVRAQTFRVTAIGDLLQRTVRSTHIQKVTTAQLADYDLDVDHAIGLELTWKDRTVKLKLGHLDKGQDVEAATTWVQDPTRPELAYQVVGRDLRTAATVA